MTKTIVNYNHNPAAYKRFAKFVSKEQFNKTMEMWLADHKRNFGKKELQAIKVLLRHSVKVIGIATIKFKSLVAVAKEKYGFDFNLRTAKRAVEKAKKFGMLHTLESRIGRKKLKGPSIYIWQPYKCQNVTTIVHENDNAIPAKNDDEMQVLCQSQEKIVRNVPQSKMSPHKASKIKTNIIKLLNTYSYGTISYKSITKKLKVKGRKEYKLLTNPVKSITEIAPLKFHSRLKQAIYNSNMNNKNDAAAIIEMVYSKVYSYTKFPSWQSHKETMLEHALRIVEACLTAHKAGKLAHVNSMRGYINSKISDEITAYVEQQLKKLMPKVDKMVSQEIIDLYGQAIHEQKAYREQLLELYYR